MAAFIIVYVKISNKRGLSSQHFSKAENDYELIVPGKLRCRKISHMHKVREEFSDSTPVH